MKELLKLKVLLLGDDGVGKSSLMMSYIGRCFHPSLPPLLTPMTFPLAKNEYFAEMMTIYDSSSNISDQHVLINKIIDVDIILALYDITNLISLDNLQTIWLPLIMENQDQMKPIILVGTKSDILISSEDSLKESKKLKEIKSRFKNIVSCRKASSLLLDVDELFILADTIIACPMKDIYDNETMIFTSLALKAYLRIFRNADRDFDGSLNELEFSNLLKSSELSLNRDELTSLLNSRLNSKESIDFDGFIKILGDYIKNENYIFPWKILDYLDYEDNLTYSVSYSYRF